MRALLVVLAVGSGLLAGCASPHEPFPPPAVAVPAAPPLTSHFMSTNEAGPVALSARYTMTVNSKCTYAAVLHTVLQQRYDWYFNVEVVRHDGTEESLVDASGPGWYPVGRVQAAGIDTRPVTHPVFEAFWSTWGVPLGRDTTVQSVYPLRLAPGDYSLRAFTNIALPDGPDETNGGSLLIGMACEHPFEVRALESDPRPLFVASQNATGTVDATLDIAAAEVHVGSASWPKPDRPDAHCVLSASQHEMAGNLTLDGDSGVDWQFTPGLDNANYRATVSPADRTLSWALAGAGPFTFWVASGGCFAPAGDVQAGSPWTPPG